MQRLLINCLVTLIFLTTVLLCLHNNSTIHNNSNNPFSPPFANRGEIYSQWLKTSVQVIGRGFLGSGTICYYDGNEAYVLSCAHIFVKSTDYAYVGVYYKNDKKLAIPSSYQAEVVCCDLGYDISVVKFHPDWKIDFVTHIASEDYKLRLGDYCYSTGCDCGSETALYVMRVVEVADDFTIM